MVKETISSSEPFKFKARLIAKRFLQVEMVDYNDFFFLSCCKIYYNQNCVGLNYSFQLGVRMVRCQNCFLHGDIEETIYMKQPKGFKVKHKDVEMVCLVKKSLYGWKQSPRRWYKIFDSFVVGVGFIRSQNDTCLYFKDLLTKVVYLLLYVDDILVAGPNIAEIQK